MGESAGVELVRVRRESGSSGFESSFREFSDFRCFLQASSILLALLHSPNSPPISQAFLQGSTAIPLIILPLFLPSTHPTSPTTPQQFPLPRNETHSIHDFNFPDISSSPKNLQTQCIKPLSRVSTSDKLIIHFLRLAQQFDV
jgi:hypothetical protein